MSRRTFIALLTLLALLEIAVLLTGRLGHVHREAAAHPAATSQGATPVAGFPAPLYIEPVAGFTWLYTLVNNAQSTLDMTMYELVDPVFSADLVQACQRGVKVRVILDQNLEKSANQPAYNQLTAAGPNCKVVWADPQFRATHQKTLIVDDTYAVVMSFNLTSRYYSDTRDMARVDADAVDVNAIELTFGNDFSAASGTAPERSSDPDAIDTLTPSPGHNLIWSPTTAQDDLVSLITGAQKTLLVENEELGASSIVNALAAVCQRGVKVQLAMTDTNVNYHANFVALQAAGCGVHIGANNKDTLYIHAKAMVADLGTPAAIGYLGSINFTTASMTQNRELGLYIHEAGLLGQISTIILSDYNQFPTYTASKTQPNAQSPRS